jgi:hypothetical protein
MIKSFDSVSIAVGSSDFTEESKNENSGIRCNIVFASIRLHACVDVGHACAAAPVFYHADFADGWTGSLPGAESQGRVEDIESAPAQ